MTFLARHSAQMGWRQSRRFARISVGSQQFVHALLDRVVEMEIRWHSMKYSSERCGFAIFAGVTSLGFWNWGQWNLDFISNVYSQGMILRREGGSFVVDARALPHSTMLFRCSGQSNSFLSSTLFTMHK